MSSLAIYGNEFHGYLSNGLAPEFFQYRLLAEGDSWMDRSSTFHTSLLQKLAQEMDRRGHEVLIINVAVFGDTIRRMGEQAQDEFGLWVNTQFDRWRFDGVLLSAGGNDYIDAARDPGPGQGILKDLRNGPDPGDGALCIKQDAVQRLRDQYMNPNFDRIYDTIQSSRHANVPCFLNYYDAPTARPAPAFDGGRSWLFDAYGTNGIPEHLWPGLTGEIFRSLGVTIDGWIKNRQNLHAVPTVGTLSPAQPGTTGSSGDWLNEIHPNAEGWEKLAVKWCDAMLPILP